MICSFCQTEIPDAALKCGHCGEYTSGECCTECLASIPSGASVCRSCGSKIKRKDKFAPVISLDMKGEVLGALIFRFRLLPQEVVADNEKIIVKAPGIFRLWEDADEIPWNKVAGFTYRNGIIWDKVEIETRGQKPSVIWGLGKTNGRALREVLQNLEK